MSTEIEHRKLIEEENIKVETLPLEIRKQIRGFGMIYGQYQKSPTDAKKKTIVKIDVGIADSIQTWLDEKSENAEELDSDDDNTEKLAPKPVAAVAAKPVEKPVVVIEPTAAEKQIAEAKAQTKNNVISVDALTKILNRAPSYPTQKIGNMVFRKQYLKNFYEFIGQTA